MKLLFTVSIMIASAIGLHSFTKNEKVRPIVDNEYVIDTLASGLIVPWAIIFLDDHTMLFTERSGKVRIMRNDKLDSKPELEIPEVTTNKKMGLLGLCKHPDFQRNPFLYIAYDYTSKDTPYLRVVRYEFKKDTMVNPKILVDSIYANVNHTGCRLKFGPDNKLYITTGDADRPMLSQNLRFLTGKILRINDDGTIPTDNPFINNDTARKQIWSYGHRNPQGIAFDPQTGDLFSSEHGPTGGDELNLIEKGKNYGWPIIHHEASREGMVSPLFQYTPSIGPSEVVVYNGDAFPQWKGKLLLASLRGESIIAINIENRKVGPQQYILQHDYSRIRALTVGPEGFLYFSTSQNDPPEGNGKPGYDLVLRMRPSGSAISNRSDSNQVQTVKVYTAKNSKQLYYELCASCHGDKMQGAPKATSMLDTSWIVGGTRADLIKSIRDGLLDKGMPAWQGAITDKQIKKLADDILKANRRARRGG